MSCPYTWTHNDVSKATQRRFILYIHTRLYNHSPGRNKGWTLRSYWCMILKKGHAGSLVCARVRVCLIASLLSQLGCWVNRVPVLEDSCVGWRQSEKISGGTGEKGDERKMRIDKRWRKELEEKRTEMKLVSSKNSKPSVGLTSDFHGDSLLSRLFISLALG